MAYGRGRDTQEWTTANGEGKWRPGKSGHGWLPCPFNHNVRFILFQAGKSELMLLLNFRMDVSDAILHASQPVFQIPTPILSPLTPTTLLFPVLDKSERELNNDRIPKRLLDLLRHVHETTLQFEFQMLGDTPPTARKMCSRESTLGYRSGSVNEHGLSSLDGHNAQNPFHIACLCAAHIHLKSLGEVVPFSSEGNQGLVNQLRLSLSEFGDEVWHETDLEIYIFLCFTGGAAAKEGRNWFLAQAWPLIMSLKKVEQQLFKSCAFRFCRLVHYIEDLD